jgi:amino acid adenylation domain-containing protein
LVAIALERSVNLVVALLAVWKAGACCLLVDTTYPRQRQEELISAAGAALILTARGIDVAAFGRLWWYIDADETGFDAGASPKSAAGLSDVGFGLQPEHPAYVTYTSGSTGAPKAVVITHRAIVNKAWTLRVHWGLSAETRFAVTTATSFDPVFDQILCPLAAGGTAVIVSDEVRDDAVAFRAYAKKHMVSALNGTPGLIEHLLGDAPGSIGPLDVLVVGGDVLTPRLANALLASGVTRRLWNSYGPTETCINASGFEVRAPENSSTVAIGAPLPNYRTYVLDPHLSLVPVEVTGDLYIGGTGVARGYLNQPAATAQSFLPDPCGAPGTRMYRSGDRVKWRPDGNLEFIGRGDAQVKVRGCRVEPAEVEAALRTIDAVKDAIVMTTSDEGRQTRLIGYVVAKPGCVLKPQDIRQQMRALLPAFMVPAAIVLLDALPLTPNGKLDRLSLLIPDGRGDGRRSRTLTPASAERTTYEAFLCTAIADVVGVEQVEPDDDFFELGGHSLLALRVGSCIREAFGVGLPLREFFDAPSIRHLASRLAAQIDGQPREIGGRPGRRVDASDDGR